MNKLTGKKGPGRPKGSKNKFTAELKEAILEAANNVGGQDGLVGYLEQQARENPGPFLALLGKVLPTQVQGQVTHNYIVRVPAPSTDVSEWQKNYAATINQTIQ